MNYEQQARKRISDDKVLSAFTDTIFYDWPNWGEHMEWIATAPAQEIIDWVESVNGYADSVAPSRLAQRTSEKRAAASRANGLKGGRPRKS